MDRYGKSLTAGDFDGDRYADLAVGVPGEGVPGASNRPGAVNVLYGGRSGVTAGGDQFFTQDSPGARDAAEDTEQFGFALTAADFDRDGEDELAVGIPGKVKASAFGVGAVAILPGSRQGLTAAGPIC